MSKTYTKKQFLADVAAEAKALKKHATKEELGLITFNELMPTKMHNCIYGLATGNCNSDRARDLIKKCCKRYFHNNGIYEIIENGMTAVKMMVNGREVEDFEEKRSGFNIGYLSSIEAYILLPEAENKNLIAFLRDERKDLVL